MSCEESKEKTVSWNIIKFLCCSLVNVCIHHPDLLIFYRYAEMPSEIKNSISHRGKALKALKEHFERTITANENQSDEPVNKKPRNFAGKT